MVESYAVMMSRFFLQLKQQVSAILNLSMGLFFLIPLASEAGVFTIPHFAKPNEVIGGVETEFTFTHGAGVAVNAKGQYGLGTFTNLLGVFGVGDGYRKFRVGSGVVFDIFPDIEGQPGVGVAAEGIYYRLDHSQDMLEASFTPYIHKTMENFGTVFEPFVATPFGWHFESGRDDAMFLNVAVGSFLKVSDRTYVVFELAVNVDNSESYISGGLSFGL